MFQPKLREEFGVIFSQKEGSKPCIGQVNQHAGFAVNTMVEGAYTKIFIVMNVDNGVIGGATVQTFWEVNKG